MEANILISIFFVAACLSLTGSVLCTRRSDEKLSLIPEIVLCFLGVISYGALVSGVLSLIHIPVNILSVGIVYLLTSSIFWFFLFQKKKWQSYQIGWFDLAVIVIIIIGTCMIAYRFYGKEMNLNYWTSDAAVHMLSANEIVLTQKVSSMYFAPLYNALVMEIFLPAFSGTMIYKGFMIADCSMIMLEMAILYVIIRPYFKKKAHMVIGMVLVGLYFAGYPLHSFIYTFNYWGVGVLTIGYLLAVSARLFSDTISKRQATLELMLGSYAVITCYMMFAPFAYIAVLLCLIYYVKNQGRRIFSWSNVLWALKIFLIPCLAGIYFCYIQFFMSQKLGVGTALNEQGAIYRELYVDFIWFVPFVLYFLIHSLRRKKINAELIFLCLFAAVEAAMFVLTWKGKISSYYYYKLYYPLWLLVFVVAARGIFLLLEEAKDFLIACISLYVGIFLLAATGMEDKIVASPAVLQLENKSSKIFGLYATNLNYIHTDWSQFEMNEHYPALAAYVTEHLGGEKKPIPMIVDGAHYTFCYWYMAFTGQKCQPYYGWVNDIDETKKLISEKKMDYVVLLYHNSYYIDNQDYWEGFDTVYQNGAGVIKRVND